VEVKIGVQYATRELVIDSALSAEEIQDEVTKALADDSGVLTLVDSKGHRVVVPSNKLAYVELGPPTVGQVGFRAK
jgi:hypothetical protein